MTGRVVAIFCVGMFLGLHGQEEGGEVAAVAEPELPGWDEDELKELEAGGYVPGSSLIGRLAAESLDSDEEDIIELAETVRALPEVDEEEDAGPVVIPEELWSEYFQEGPQSLLNDPQKLLTTQEFQDREGFLSYHAKDHEIVLYLTLFDEKQTIPEGLELRDVVAARWDPGKAAAVVFYFLGAPERSQAFFTRRVIDPTGEKERAEALLVSIEAAKEVSDPSSQLDAFSMQFSSSLSMLEELVEKSGGNLSLMATVESDDGGVAEGGARFGWLVRLLENENLFWGVVGGLVLVTAGLLGWVGRTIAARRREYLFPDAEGGTLMEAPYAAGVGGVLSFASAQTPPSRQQSDVPDYLQKM